MAATELAGTWVFNDYITPPNGNDVTFNFSFISYYSSCSGIRIVSEDGSIFYIDYIYEDTSLDPARVYTGSWDREFGQTWQTIKILSKLSEVTNGDTLLAWLQANATKQETDTSKKLTKLKYKASDVCQLMDKDKFFATRTIGGVTFTNNGDGSLTINCASTDNTIGADNPLFLPPTGYSQTFDLYSIEGHKYLLIPLPQSFSYSTLRFIFGSVDSSNGVPYYETSDTYKIYTATKTGTYPCYAIYRVGKGTTINNLTVKPQLFDLTEMYGAGNEPTTLAEFRQKYPNDLYPYSPQCWYSINKTRYMSNQYGNIDLSTLGWSKEGLNFASTPLSNVKIPDPNVAANMICSKYRSVPLNASFVEGDFAINPLGMLYVRDTKYGDVISFKESLKNLILTYELATNSSGGYLPLNKGVKI